MSKPRAVEAFLQLPREKQLPWLRAVCREFSAIAFHYFEHNRFTPDDLDELDKAIDMKDARLLFEELRDDDDLKALTHTPTTA